MYAYIILHNMIIESEGDAATDWEDDDAPPTATINMGSGSQAFENYLKNYNDLCNMVSHHQLRSDLCEHIW